MRLIGLNPALRAAFYPHYAFGRTLPGPRGPPDLFDDRKTPRARGKDVDRQTAAMVSLTAGKPDWAAFLGTSRAWVRRSTPLFRDQIVPYLVREKLRPVGAQVAVSRDRARVGTAIDLVCRAEDGRAVLFELKIGYSTYLYRHTAAPMRAPFGAWNDCPLHQFYLYLAFAADMHPGPVDLARCAVLRITPRGLAVHMLPLHVLPAWAVLEPARDLTKQDRDRAVRNAKRRRLT